MLERYLTRYDFVFTVAHQFFFDFSAPTNVRLQENLTVIEKTSSAFVCSYNEANLRGSTTIFYIGNVGIEIAKVEF